MFVYITKKIYKLRSLMGKTPLDFEWKLGGVIVFEIKKKKKRMREFLRQHTERQKNRLRLG